MDKDAHRNSDNIRVGAAVKALREARGLTRAQVAGKIGRSEQLVGAIERGFRAATPPVRRALADAMGVPLAALGDEAAFDAALGHLLHDVQPAAAS